MEISIDAMDLEQTPNYDKIKIAQKAPIPVDNTQVPQVVNSPKPQVLAQNMNGGPILLNLDQLAQIQGLKIPVVLSKAPKSKKKPLKVKIPGKSQNHNFAKIGKNGF